jgi:hypothetical protein
MLSVNLTVGMGGLCRIWGNPDVLLTLDGVKSAALFACVLLWSVPALAQAPIELPMEPTSVQIEAVEKVLRAPSRDAGTSATAQHVQELRGLGFDPLPAARALLVNNWVATEAARAMIALDSTRGTALIMDSIPGATLSAQVVGFVWFLDNQATLAASVGPQAHAAASRVLARIESTSVAEMAIYTIGIVGSDRDFPVLEEFAAVRNPAGQGLRNASEAALSRLGSTTHLESLRAQLTEPLPERPTYGQGMRLAGILRQAAFSGNRTLVPAVCAHMSDPPIGDVDIRIDPPLIAANALRVLLEPVTAERPRTAPRRSLDEWKAYCAQLP